VSFGAHIFKEIDEMKLIVLVLLSVSAVSASAQWTFVTDADNHARLLARDGSLTTALSADQTVVILGGDFAFSDTKGLGQTFHVEILASSCQTGTGPMTYTMNGIEYKAWWSKKSDKMYDFEAWTLCSAYNYRLSGSATQ
jgi:hypothetical protein